MTTTYLTANSVQAQKQQLEQRDCSWPDTAMITGVVLMALASLALISGVIGYYLAGYTSMLKTLAPVAGAATLGTLLLGFAIVCGSSSKVSIVNNEKTGQSDEDQKKIEALEAENSRLSTLTLDQDGQIEKLRKNHSALVEVNRGLIEECTAKQGQIEKLMEGMDRLLSLMNQGKADQ